jgi:hypothetical protein
MDAMAPVVHPLPPAGASATRHIIGVATVSRGRSSDRWAETSIERRTPSSGPLAGALRQACARCTPIRVGGGPIWRRRRGEDRLSGNEDGGRRDGEYCPWALRPTRATMADPQLARPRGEGRHVA